MTLLTECSIDGLMSGAAVPPEIFEVAVNYCAAQRRLRLANYFRTCYVAKVHPYCVTYQENSAQRGKAAPNDVRLTKEIEPAKVCWRVSLLKKVNRQRRRRQLL